MLITTFHGSQDRTFTKMYLLYNQITTADSEWCEAVNAMVVKNVKDASVPLKLFPICREHVNVVSRFGCKKNSLSFSLHIYNAF